MNCGIVQKKKNKKTCTMNCGIVVKKRENNLARASQQQPKNMDLSYNTRRNSIQVYTKNNNPAVTKKNSPHSPLKWKHGS